MANESSEMVRRQESEPEYVRRELRVTPLVDVYENQDELLMIADVPGVTEDNLDIQFHEGQLSIEARQPSEGEGDDKPQPMVFARSFTVPTTIDAEKVSAELEAGILRVHLPKSEAAKPRRIAVKAG